MTTNDVPVDNLIEMTEAQMRTRLLVIDCGRAGHAPASVVREHGSDLAVAAYCECCEYRWIREEALS